MKAGHPGRPCCTCFEQQQLHNQRTLRPGHPGKGRMSRTALKDSFAEIESDSFHLECSKILLASAGIFRGEWIWQPVAAHVRFDACVLFQKLQCHLISDLLLH